MDENVLNFIWNIQYTYVDLLNNKKQYKPMNTTNTNQLSKGIQVMYHNYNGEIKVGYIVKIGSTSNVRNKVKTYSTYFLIGETPTTFEGYCDRTSTLRGQENTKVIAI